MSQGQGKYQFFPTGEIPGGRITLFREPPADRHCAMGVDTALGLRDGDYDTAIILDAAGEQLLTVEGHWGENFSAILWPILQWYKPFLVVERQALGLKLVRDVYKRGYTWVYYNRDEAKRGRPQTDTFGHARHTADVIIPNLQQAIAPRDGKMNLLPSRITVRDAEVHRQLCLYQWLPRASSMDPEEATDSDLASRAPDGEHDDLVMALAYAWTGVLWLPQFQPPPALFAPNTYGAVFGTPATVEADRKKRAKGAFAHG